jgi:hypothetical protein
MSDRELPPDDDLGARIGLALRHDAERRSPTAPPASVIRAAAQREDRNRRLQLGAIVAAAAVLVTSLLLVRSGDDEASYVTDDGTTESTAIPEELHLVLDSPEHRLSSAVERRLTLEGHPPGTTRPEGRSQYEVVVYGDPDRIDGPRLILAVRSQVGPLPPLDDRGGLDQRLTIAGRPATLRTTSGGPTLIVRWDDTHEVAANFPGLDQASAEAALSTLAVDDGGRWSLSAAPAGLVEIGRASPDATGPGWYDDATTYEAITATPDTSMMGLVRLTITRVEPDVHGDDIFALALQAGQGAGSVVERTTIRGHDALVVTPGPDAPLDDITYAWLEPDHDVVVRVQVDTLDRTDADQVVASLREVGPQEWSALLASCVVPAVEGMAFPTTEGETGGGACPR